MAEVKNPHIEVREPSKGELDQYYAGLFNMAALFFGLKFTDNEKKAIPVVIGAVMRERTKIDFATLSALFEQFLPKE